MIVERSPAPSCLALGAGSKEHHDYFLLNSGKERVCEGLPTPLGKKKKKWLSNSSLYKSPDDTKNQLSFNIRFQMHIFFFLGEN